MQILLIIVALNLTVLFFYIIKKVASFARRHKKDAILLGLGAGAVTAGVKVYEHRAEQILKGHVKYSTFDLYILKSYIALKFTSMRAAYEYAMQQLTDDTQWEVPGEVIKPWNTPETSSEEFTIGSYSRSVDDSGSEDQEEQPDSGSGNVNAEAKQESVSKSSGSSANGDQTYTEASQATIPPGSSSLLLQAVEQSESVPPPPAIANEDGVPHEEEVSDDLKLYHRIKQEEGKLLIDAAKHMPRKVVRRNTPQEAERRLRIKMFFDELGFDPNPIKYRFQDDSGLDKALTIDQLIDLAKEKAAVAHQIDQPEARTAEDKAEKIVEEVGFCVKGGPLSSGQLSRLGHTLGLSYIPNPTSVPNQQLVRSVEGLISESVNSTLTDKWGFKAPEKFDFYTKAAISAQYLACYVAKNPNGEDPWTRQLKMIAYMTSWMGRNSKSFIDEEERVRSLILKTLQVLWAKPELVKEAKEHFLKLCEKDSLVNLDGLNSLALMVNTYFREFQLKRLQNGLFKKDLHEIKHKLSKEYGLAYLRTYFSFDLTKSDLQTDIRQQPVVSSNFAWNAPMVFWQQCAISMRKDHLITKSEIDVQLFQSLYVISHISDQNSISLILSLFNDPSVMSATLRKSRITILTKGIGSLLCPIVLLKKSYRQSLGASLFIQATSSLCTPGTLRKDLTRLWVFHLKTSRTLGEYYAEKWALVFPLVCKLLAPAPRPSSLRSALGLAWLRRLPDSLQAHGNSLLSRLNQQIFNNPLPAISGQETD